jgi:ABC-2 type transport system ATP-binding protein
MSSGDRLRRSPEPPRTHSSGGEAVVASGLSRTYGDRRALDGVSLSVAKGETFALLGPNGGGKTTLFRILATLLPPSGGSFSIDGLDPARETREVRRRLGVVFQAPSVDRKLTARENLLYGAALYGLGAAAARSRADELLLRLGILDRAADPVERLSGGLMRRVEIAKALLHAPSVLLLDEPSTGLDPGARRDLRALLAELARGGTTVLLTTHLFEEADAADRIGILDRGRLVAIGAPGVLKGHVGGEVIAVEAGGEPEAATLAKEIATRFDGAAGRVAAVGATVRLERRDAHTFVPELVEAFPGRFVSLTLGRPTLEDVFVDATGHAFREDAHGEAR